MVARSATEAPAPDLGPPLERFCCSAHSWTVACPAASGGYRLRSIQRCTVATVCIWPRTLANRSSAAAGQRCERLKARSHAVTIFAVTASPHAQRGLSRSQGRPGSRNRSSVNDREPANVFYSQCIRTFGNRTWLFSAYGPGAAPAFILKNLPGGGCPTPCVRTARVQASLRIAPLRCRRDLLSHPGPLVGQTARSCSR